MPDKFKVLSVDDSRLVRIQVKRALEAFDVEVLEAENGQVGYEVATRDRPDLILLDITMPVMNGHELLQKLRAEEAFKQIPIVMLSADLSKDTMIKMAKSGSNDYIPKPFKPEIIVEKVETFLKRELKARKVEKRLEKPKQLNAVKMNIEAERDLLFIPENDSLSIRFPNDSERLDRIAFIGQEYHKHITEALSNNIYDIFIDLSLIQEITVMLAAIVSKINKSCDELKARCHVLVGNNFEDQIKCFPGCNKLNFYRPPEAH